jgi:hypothetical protein
MNRDDIIRWAQQAGFDTKRDMIWVDLCEITPGLTRFAALVRADEREACAKVAEQWGRDIRVETWDMAGKDCAAAIRARGRDADT